MREALAPLLLALALAPAPSGAAGGRAEEKAGLERACLADRERLLAQGSPSREEAHAFNARWAQAFRADARDAGQTLHFRECRPIESETASAAPPRPLAPLPAAAPLRPAPPEPDRAGAARREETRETLALYLALFGLALLVVGAGAAWHVPDPPLVKAAMAQDGPVKVEGAARADVPLKDPVFQEDCVYYRLRAIQGSGKNQKIVLDQASDQAFSIEDETGRVRVRPAGAHFALPSRLLEAEPRVEAFLESRGLRPKNVGLVRSVLQHLGGGLKLHALVVKPGDLLCAAGSCSRREGAATIAREYGRRFSIFPSEDALVRHRRMWLAVMGVGAALLAWAARLHWTP